MALDLKIITGSTRPGRKGPVISDWVLAAAKAHAGFDAEIFDLAELDRPLLDEPNHPSLQEYTKAHTKKLSAAMGEADAFVFVTPEYDFFPPASLINMVQCLLLEWQKKPAGVVSYGGISGGLRSSQTLRLLLGNVGMVAVPQSVPLPLFSQHISDAGVFEGTEPMNDGLTLMLDALQEWGTTLKGLRDSKSTA